VAKVDEETKQLLRDLIGVVGTLASVLGTYITIKATRPPKKLKPKARKKRRK
jgi:hypothetical protein